MPLQDATRAIPSCRKKSIVAMDLVSSSKTVGRHIGKLEDKKLILVSQGKNNTYYLPNYLHVHPYLLLSEKTHEFVGSVFLC